MNLKLCFSSPALSFLTFLFFQFDQKGIPPRRFFLTGDHFHFGINAMASIIFVILEVKSSTRSFAENPERGLWQRKPE